MNNIDRCTGHSRMSDPAGHAAMIAKLPTEIGRLNSVIQGTLIHSDWLAEYGLDESHVHAVSRKTLAVADRLTDILARDGCCLETQRPAERRAIGTCRDFALMLCCFLRCKGVPSRLRCGFAAYFGHRWEDHWVCEYWDKQTQTWRLSDPQIDQVLKDRLRITFDPRDVPRQLFIMAGQAWSNYRTKRSDPKHFGHGPHTGLWFVRVNVIRDHYALNGRETSAWDGWRAALPDRVICESEVTWLDSIAARPEQQLIEIHPDWLI